MDLRDDRINVAVEDGVITEVLYGGFIRELYAGFAIDQVHAKLPRKPASRLKSTSSRLGVAE